MGAGASSMRELDLGVTTLVLGQALAAITFPDMFRLHDFHSPRAPRLRSIVTITWFGGVQEIDEEELDEDYREPAPEEYQHMFNVQLGDQRIYIEDVLQPNALGWTPLHACCHSSNTMGAAFKIIEEMQRRGGSFETQTVRGPGIFNAGWTALHMATAYGLEALVAVILNAGANPNCRNSYGFTPLFEACHRGFLGIAKLLVDAKADLNPLPTEEEANSCPLLSAPPQTPLGEAARFGFTPIVQLLLEAGADKNFRNSAGWTPLHEAAFFNHVHSVQLLLVHGADPTIKCNRGLVPWQLARSSVMKDLIAELGGEAAVVAGGELDQQRATATINEEDMRAHFAPNSLSSPERRKQQHAGDSSKGDSTPTAIRTAPATPKQRECNPTQETQSHTPERRDQGYSLLGDLPSLQSRAGVGMPHSMDTIPAEPKTPSSSLKLRSPARSTAVAPKDSSKEAPQEFMCALSKQLMCDPVRTAYGQVFEKEMILAWIKQHGHICPITAMPLAETDLTPDAKLRERILAWKIGREENVDPAASQPGISGASNPQGDDDLYNF